LRQDQLVSEQSSQLVLLLKLVEFVLAQPERALKLVLLLQQALRLVSASLLELVERRL
jgi:hypothetical protein